MHSKLLHLKLVLIIIFICFTFLLGAEDGKSKSLNIKETNTIPKIDGRIDDACWGKLEPVSGFYQFDPVNGAKASEETFVWITYDKKYIYFAFLMKDSQPDKIWAELTPRNQYRANDSVTVILDTYNDKRTSIQFTVNARGVQRNSVETIWKSGAQRREDGWSAEIAIPFKSLRFSPKDKQTWGINFNRYIHRLNEQQFWTNVDRNIPRQQQMGTLYGIQGVKPSYNLEFFPYFGIRSSRWNDEKDDKVAVGMDVKYGILPNLILDLTASPDFSEVESDPFIYQLSPYENYLRENRLFFNEGKQYFGSSRRRHFGPPRQFNLFYSRRISSPKFAAKITGKSNGWSYGLLGSFNKGDEEEEIEDNFFSVLRIQKDIFKNSQIGFYYTGLDEEQDYNRNVGIDYNFNFSKFYYIRGQSAFSFNKNAESNNIGLHMIQFQRNPDAGLQYELTYRRVEKDVDVRTGYINKTDTQSTDLELGYGWRFNNKKMVKRVSAELQAGMEHDTDGNLTKTQLEISGRMEFLSQLSLNFSLESGQSKYQIYDEEDNLYWDQDFIDVYGGRAGMRWERGGFLKRVHLWARWHNRGIYNDEYTAVDEGSELNLDASLTLRPFSSFEFSLGGEWTRQTIKQTGEIAFEGFTYNGGLHYQISRRLFANTRLKGETRDGQYNLDVLIGYYFGAGNIIQLCYKNSNRLEEDILEKGYSITLKISYLLRI